MNVKPTSCFVGQNEVTFPSIITVLLAKAPCGEHAKTRYLCVRQGDIEVIVGQSAPRFTEPSVSPGQSV